MVIPSSLLFQTVAYAIPMACEHLYKGHITFAHPITHL